jgi:hypothetical protein
VNGGPDLLAIATTAIAASTTTPDDLLAVYYCACARVALSKLKDQLKAVAAIVAARELELVQRGAPKGQESFPIDEGAR